MFRSAMCGVLISICFLLGLVKLYLEGIVMFVVRFASVEFERDVSRNGDMLCFARLLCNFVNRFKMMND